MKVKFTISLLLFTFLGFGQSNVSGVITYFFNKYQGDKPDLGAQVIAIDSSKAPSDFNYGDYEKFYYGSSNKKLLNSYKSISERWRPIMEKYEGKKKYKDDYDAAKKWVDDSEKEVAQFSQKLADAGLASEESFKELDKKVLTMLLSVGREEFHKKTVDGNGSYKLNLKPGTYYIYIKSKGRTGLSMTEITGKIYIKKVRVKENEEVDLSYNFTM